MVNHASAQAYKEGRVGAENSHFTNMHEKIREESESWNDWPKVTKLGCGQEPKTFWLHFLLHAYLKIFIEHLQWVMD